MFGFIKNRQIIPNVFKDYSQYEINYIFLNFYNALNESDMKIPYKYAKVAKNLKDIFKLYIQDLLESGDDFEQCVYSKEIIEIYKKNGFCNSLKHQIPDLIPAKLILNIFFQEEFLIDPQVVFENFVFDKIAKTNPKLKINIKNNLCIIGNKMAISAKFFQDEKNDIDYALRIISQNSFDKFYIVYPRSKKFTQYKQIRHFLCENNNTLLKLVPYTINNQILRR
ncbi:hypothetical protein [Campylobacter insulaenigrae]|uniref:Uncharacterized protein n=1 Tax=Campylobacter insulaenigrae NCTC 12927 TaxID=1031564 RepID=A0A0A8H0T8_9BACT|nr:hypothetical protein [Campylobacter insulaenigrae]AJC87390.1 hypothetical protein CINS_0391 [Campylobacter insulaenigrae NCTC 12927]VEH93308.1 Uncharacterised protein [Campylobacter insulaenigrae]